MVLSRSHEQELLMNYLKSAAIGAVSGLRSLSGAAALAQKVANRPAGRIVAALALGEIVADKLPFVPDRTKPPLLIFRLIAGAACGYMLAPEDSSDQEKWISAAIAAGAAAAAAYAGLQFRNKAKLPGAVSGLIEDAIAYGSGAAIAYSQV
jgi:uncharacterized membrane protein